MQKIEPSINYKNTNETYLKVAKGEESNEGYIVTAVAQNTGDEFSIVRNNKGELEHTCNSPKTKTGCAGKSEKSSSW